MYQSKIMKVGQEFNYYDTPHRIEQINSRTVITRRLDNNDLVTWDYAELLFILNDMIESKQKQQT